MSAPSAINKVRQIIVGNTPSTNTITTGDLNSATFSAATNAGEIGIFTPEGTRLDESGAATADRFVVAVSRGTSAAPLVSDVIIKSTMKNTLRKVYAAATEQSTYIGYNGTSGSIADVATYAGDLYKVKVILQQLMSGSDDERIKNSVYKSLSTDGQAEVALGIAASLQKNMSREVKNSAGNPPIVTKAICNAALAAAFDFDETITVTKGSNQILLANDIDYNTGTDVVVGDYIRLGATATSAVALTSPVYKIVAIDGLVLTLDQEVQSASGSYVTGSSYSQVIPNADGQAANWGVVMTAQPLPWNVSKKRYSKLRFQVQPSEEFGSTVVGNSANASEGTGTYEQVAELENFLMGFRGEQYEMGEPNLFDSSALRLASSSVAGGGYDLITLSHSNTHTNFQPNVAKKELVIAVPATAPNFAVTGASDDVTDILEVLAFGSANGNLAMS